MEEKLVDLSETIAGMQSDDYKERFVAEYHQVRTRKAKLDAFIATIKTAKEHGDPEPRHDCPVWVLEEQSEAMAKYQAMLEIRAKDYEGINLSAKKERMTSDEFANIVKARRGNILGRKVSELLDMVDFQKGDAHFLLCATFKVEFENEVIMTDYIPLSHPEMLKTANVLDYRISSIFEDDERVRWIVYAKKDDEYSRFMEGLRNERR